MKIPEQYNQVMPYLIINNAAAFIDFMKTVFDAEVQMTVPREEGVIMHGELRLGQSVIMIADATEQYPARPAGMFIYINSVDETYKKALEAGAKSSMPPTKQDYGYTCGFTDPFGNDWWPSEAPEK